jgi:hypothetical protein
MLFYTISLGLSVDKENKKSVANDIRDDDETANETMRRSISKEEGAR